MRRNYSTCADPLAERVKRLESELDSARLSILELMPGEVRHDLMGYYTTDSRKASTDWAVQVVQVIIERAELLPRPNEYFDERAMCPLCRGVVRRATSGDFLFPKAFDVIWSATETLGSALLPKPLLSLLATTGIASSVRLKKRKARRIR